MIFDEFGKQGRIVRGSVEARFSLPPKAVSTHGPTVNLVGEEGDDEGDTDSYQPD